MKLDESHGTSQEFEGQLNALGLGEASLSEAAIRRQGLVLFR